MTAADVSTPDSHHHRPKLTARIFVGIIRFYQQAVSPYFGRGSCRFDPTCSEYAVEAIRKYGVIKGSIMSIWRILRCNPWGGFGYDPPVWFGEKRESREHD